MKTYQRLPAVALLFLAAGCSAPARALDVLPASVTFQVSGMQKAASGAT